MSRGRMERVDSSTLLGIGGRGSLLLLMVFMLVNLTFTIGTLDNVSNPWVSLAALVLANYLATLLVRPHPDPFPMTWTLAIAVGVVAITAAVSWNLAPSGPDAALGREAWHLGACAWLCFFTAMRGRLGFAWLGYAGVAAVTIVWSIDAGRGALGALGMLQFHVGVVVIGTVLTLGLRQASSRINTLANRSVELAAASAAADAERRIREQRVAELGSLARPLLKRIVAGDRSKKERADYLLAEATLRDSVRARSLYTGDIVKATAEARSRGVEVTLLDDRGEALPTAEAMAVLGARISQTLNSLDSGKVTVRLAPMGRDVAASIVVSGPEITRRLDIDEQGDVLDEAGKVGSRP